MALFIAIGYAYSNPLSPQPDQATVRGDHLPMAAITKAVTPGEGGVAKHSTPVLLAWLQLGTGASQAVTPQQQPQADRVVGAQFGQPVLYSLPRAMLAQPAQPPARARGAGTGASATERGGRRTPADPVPAGANRLPKHRHRELLLQRHPPGRAGNYLNSG